MSNGWTATIKGMPTQGARGTRSRKMSHRLIDLYAEITDDRNPLHFDIEAAHRSVFGGLIVQGGITSGILNAIVAEDLPGPGTVFVSMDLRFVKAVYVDDTITGEVIVKSVREDKPICTLQVAVLNQHGETCLQGTAVTYTAALLA